MKSTGPFSRWWRRAGILSATAVAALATTSASALEIELSGGGADRIQRQRAFERGTLPLPSTPDLERLPERLSKLGLRAGDPVFLRVFKAESELEVWVAKADGMVRLATYPICHWSGSLGPKLIEGDRQAPEGFYTITRRQLHLSGRWPRSLNLGFPNEVDKALGRSGSYILIHGGCTSIGCFAMTNPVMAEIYQLVDQALKSGQERVHVHVFPFRLTDDKLSASTESPWYPFWQTLKVAYDQFETTRAVPRVSYCENRYIIAPSGEEGPDPGPLAVCGGSPARTPPQENVASQNSLPGSASKRPTFADSPSAATRASDFSAQIPCNLARPSCRKWSFLKSTSRQRSKVAESRSRRSQ